MKSPSPRRCSASARARSRTVKPAGASGGASSPATSSPELPPPHAARRTANARASRAGMERSYGEIGLARRRSSGTIPGNGEARMKPAERLLVPVGVAMVVAFFAPWIDLYGLVTASGWDLATQDEGN